MAAFAVSRGDSGLALGGTLDWIDACPVVQLLDARAPAGGGGGGTRGQIRRSGRLRFGLWSRDRLRWSLGRVRHRMAGVRRRRRRIQELKGGWLVSLLGGGWWEGWGSAVAESGRDF